MTQDEQLATIGRICTAAGIGALELALIERVKVLAREHAARGAMVAVLNHQANQRLDDAARRGMYISEPIPGRPSALYAGDRYYADEEDARRARLDLEEAQRRDVEQLTAAAGERVAAELETGRAA